MTPIFTRSINSEDIVYSNQESLRAHVEFLTDSTQDRSHENIERLNEVASYIYDDFRSSGCDSIEYQTFEVEGSEYKNVICEFSGESEELIVVWAHYDVQHFAWADDNASGTAGLLELAALLWNQKPNLKNPLQLVAYTLEEMPHFRTANMWSYKHAEMLKQKGSEVKYMISLEMIGYFTEEQVQKYPVPFMDLLYPKEWNFIALVWVMWKSWHLKDIKKSMKWVMQTDLYTMKAPSFVSWIDLSDHRNYWIFDYEAYILTDTSFFRNPNYHKVTDTINTLNFEKMSDVVNGVYRVVSEER